MITEVLYGVAEPYTNYFAIYLEDPLHLPQNQTSLLQTYFMYSTMIEYETVQKLLQSGLKANHMDSMKITVIYYACANKHTPLDAIELLLENGADLNF